MRLTISLAWGISLVHCAVDLTGVQVVAPVSEDDPAPISDSRTYYPELSDCPLTCSAYSNINAWTTYFSLERLNRCKEPMLLQFSVNQPLRDPQTTVLIRSCTLPSEANESLGNTTTNPAATGEKVENPKKVESLYEAALDVAPACAIRGKQVKSNVHVSKGSAVDSQISNIRVERLLKGMRFFFEDEDNCDESIIFGYHQQTVAGIYIGAGLGKPSINSVLSSLVESFGSGHQTVAQVCDEDRQRERILGISIDNDLPSLQETVATWSEGNCVNSGDLTTHSQVPAVALFDITLANVNDALGEGDPTFQKGTVSQSASIRARPSTSSKLDERATCRYIKVVSGDGCASLASKCHISGTSFEKFNSYKQKLCSTLRPGNYVCCSAGTPYSPPKIVPPKKNADGTCATHLIANGDLCANLAKKYGLTVVALENFNRGKVWAWTDCSRMLVGYNMCLSEGRAPLPPPQQGAECGPLVPGTKLPANSSMSLASLNPCPLKACCSNWGFCGPFAAHCEVHAPTGGGPGAKLPNYASTCISNCGNAIKQNSGPPTKFARIGYYESWNLGRDCLWLKAENANTDGSYTHMHWGFAKIDPKTWKVVISDPYKQWESFKKLELKRIISFGGWAYSTEPATYNIIRQAIINNREVFATNVAQFINEQKLDGVDFDWEYPGAPDIMVDGKPIGQPGDGVAYLKFLTSLKKKLSNKSVSIAAPASYWYLKAFPIDRIAAVIDYIVYMTYDLHGQWDYGNVNSFDSCSSGKCIRSHVNLTETRNTLSIITKAGVPNNKIFVGEASYGRSFHMAKNGCWGPLCDFTGSRTVSNARPGRCTKTSGYLAHAEINEIIGRGLGAKVFYDKSSDTDVMLFAGDFISYMTPTTKSARRAIWKALNFAGSIDWAVDLQAFGTEDITKSSGAGKPGSQGCVSGRDLTLSSGDLCEFTCAFDFCPATLCECRIRGTIEALPHSISGDFVAYDDLDLDLNRLCRFACKHGYCPEDFCMQPVVDEDENGITNDPTDPSMDTSLMRRQNAENCIYWRDPKLQFEANTQCYSFCQDVIEEAAADKRISNYGCVSWTPAGQKEVGWTRPAGVWNEAKPGKCFCDNWFINQVTESVMEALPIIAQIGCYILMSTFKWVLDIGAELLTGGAGKAINAGLDMATTAAQTIAYLYPEDEKPEDAFSWWLSPCGGTELVPDEVKRVFDILNQFSGSSFRPPRNLKKGSGKKGDEANPIDRSKPKAGTGTGPSGSGGGKKSSKKCKIKAGQESRRLAGGHMLQKQKCVGSPATTQKNEMFVTSLAYAANAKTKSVVKHCDAAYTQACYHYSSAIRNNPSWSKLLCPVEAAQLNHRLDGFATSTWSGQHSGDGWQDPKYRAHAKCDRDEYPPAYLLHKKHAAYLQGGKNAQGQLVRYLPDGENRGAGQIWRGVCFLPPLKDLTDLEFERRVNADPKKTIQAKAGVTQTFVSMTVNSIPEFSFGSWGHAGKALPDDGLRENPCWPSGLAKNDPGFALLTFDPWYGGNAPPFNYRAAVP